MEENKENHAHTMAIAGLIVNLFIPGLGSIIGGKTNAGIIQLVLSALSAFLIITVLGALIGIPLAIAMWIWALITGIKMVKKTSVVVEKKAE